MPPTRDDNSQFPKSMSKRAVEYDEATKVIKIDSALLDSMAKKKTISCLVCIYVYGDQVGRRIELNLPTVLIGRSSECNIVLSHESVSRKHCIIEVQDDGRVFLTDLGSTNGTRVNDEKIPPREPTRLRDGDIISVGSDIFKFLSGDNIEASYYDEIYRLTTTDGLTGIYNKRYYMEALEKEISRARRYRRPLSLIMFDIDHFKRINDTYGHLAGDFVLRKLATVIKEKIRKEDFFARYGGEEFSIILPELPLDKAGAFGEKIRHLVEHTNFVFEGIRIPITISVGVATFDFAMQSSEELILLADQNLYEAKRTGRNKTVG